MDVTVLLIAGGRDRLFLVVSIAYYRLRAQISERAEQRHAQWRERELGRERAAVERVIRAELQVEQAQWVVQREQTIRDDAIRRSGYVGIGNAMQHFAPHLAGFKYDPRDVRWFGEMFDLIVFDGLSSGRLRQIVFIEVKTGASASLTDRQREIRDAVHEHRIVWELLRIGPRPEA